MPDRRDFLEFGKCPCVPIFPLCVGAGKVSIWLWRTHSCRCLACEMKAGAAMSGDTARTSACATIPECRNCTKNGQAELIAFRRPGTEVGYFPFPASRVCVSGLDFSKWRPNFSSICSRNLAARWGGLSQWLWRTHSCVPQRQSCRCLACELNRCRQEWRHGTHECVRHYCRMVTLKLSLFANRVIA